MLSKFENLPDEIIMIILKYCGDAYTILKIFLGFNQRLNRILIDKRLHLLTDFLNIKAYDDYSNSHVFQQVSEQLLSINTTIDEKTLSSIFQSLLSFHIEQKYIKFGYEFQSSVENFKSIRQILTNNEKIELDNKLTTIFHSRSGYSLTKEFIERIESLVVKEGGRYESDDNELCRRNFTKFVNEFILCHINNIEYQSSISINSYIKILKVLIVSNNALINDKDYTGNGGSKLYFFLVYILYRLENFYHGSSSLPINMKYYRITVDLFLFVIQCEKQMFVDENNIRNILFEILSSISKIQDDIFIQTCQWELLKIVTKEFIMKANEPWDDYSMYEFRRILRKLIENKRYDVLDYLYRRMEFQRFFNVASYTRECIDFMTINQDTRKVFYLIINENLTKLVFSEKDLLFALLDKKERKLLEKLLKSSSHLIDELDQDGNNPLLYICLKVRGCRHRIIEMLINAGVDVSRINYQGQNFMDILQLQKNQKLYQRLIEYAIIPS